MSDYAEQINTVLNRIEEHLGENISLDSLAEAVELPGFVLEQIFAFFIGTTIRDYVRIRRISRAAHDLVETDCTIAEIAARYAYASEATFTKAFQNIEGVTPKKARRSGCVLYESNIPYLKRSEPLLTCRPFSAPYRTSFQGPFPRLSDAARSANLRPITDPCSFVEGSGCDPNSSAAYAWDPRIEEPGDPPFLRRVFKICSSESPFYTTADFHVPRLVNGIILMTGDANFEARGNLPRDWELCGSNDLTEWKGVAAGDGSELTDCDYQFFAAPVKSFEAFRYFRFSCRSQSNLFVEFNQIILCSPDAPESFGDVFHFSGACIDEKAAGEIPLLKNNGRDYADADEALRDLGLFPLYAYRFVWGTNGYGADFGPEQIWNPDPETSYATTRNPACGIIETEKPVTVAGIVLINSPEQEEEPQRCPDEWQLLGLNERWTWDIIARGDGSFLGGKAKACHAALIERSRPYRFFQFRLHSRKSVMSHMGTVVLGTEEPVG